VKIRTNSVWLDIIHGDIKLENILLKSNEEQEAGIPTVKG